MPAQRSKKFAPLSLQEYKQLCAYIEEQPATESELVDALSQLQEFPAITWVAIYIGILDRFLEEPFWDVPQIHLVRDAIDEWLSCPCDFHLQQAVWVCRNNIEIFNDDKISYVGQVITTNLATLFNDKGQVNPLMDATSLFEVLSFIDTQSVWQSIVTRLRCLEFMDVVIEQPSPEEAAKETPKREGSSFSVAAMVGRSRPNQILPRFGVRARQIALLTLFVAVITLIITVANIASMTKVIINRNYKEAEQLANQIKAAIQQDLNRNSLNDFGDPYAMLAGENTSTRGLMVSTLINTRPIAYLYLTDNEGRFINDVEGRDALLINAHAIGDANEVRPDLSGFVKENAYQQLIHVFGKQPIYQFNKPVTVDNPNTGEPFDLGLLHIGVSSLQIRNELFEPIKTNLLIGLLAIVATGIIATISANTLLRPLEVISSSIEKLGSQENPSEDFHAKNMPHDDVVTGVTARLKQLGARLAGEREELEIMRGRLRQVVNHLEDRLILINREGRVILASPDAERLLGVKDVELTGLPIDESLGARHPLVGLVERSLNERRSIARTTIKAPDDPAQRQVLASVQYIEDAGSPVGVLVGLRDYESYQKFESQWDLSKKLADLGRITSGIAHEVKNPLNAMVIHLEILRSKIETGTHDTKPQLEILDSEIKRLDRVVQTFLNFTRPVEIRLEPLDINLIINQVVALASMEAAERGVTINKQLSPGKLMIKGDSDLLKQAMLNVILNGCQAMPKGGLLEIKTLPYDEEKVCILVKDRGIGIPVEARERIFNLYYTTKQGGTGIGLAQAFRAIQLHNGTISFDSEVGKGTTFEIILPSLE
ncbi:MAG: ATP-binding protein [Acidobacteriota bacterium]